jgi:cytochrome b561
MHHLLHALLVAIVRIGLGCGWIRGDTVFKWFTVPAFDPGNKALVHNAVELHAWLVNLWLALAGIHAITAAWQHRALKDGVMQRMLLTLALRMSQRKASAADTF